MSAIWLNKHSKLVNRLSFDLFRRCHQNVRLQSSATSAEKTTIDAEELHKFDLQSSFWWNLHGQAKPLHSMNDLRVPFIRDGILQTIKDESKRIKSSKPLEGLSILDIGCGGGLLSEPLARLGAKVNGLDVSNEMIKIASEHAKLDSEIINNLTYECQSIEEHAADKSNVYDAVVASEVVEHIDNLRMFVSICTSLTKENGSLFFTTINKTQLSKFLAIFMAEFVLNIVEKGTHSYEKFVPPQQLERVLKDDGCRVHLCHGMCYNPFTNRWHWIRQADVNYAIHAVKEKIEINVP